MLRRFHDRELQAKTWFRLIPMKLQKNTEFNKSRESGGTKYLHEFQPKSSCCRASSFQDIFYFFERFFLASLQKRDRIKKCIGLPGSVRKKVYNFPRH